MLVRLRYQDDIVNKYGEMINIVKSIAHVT